MKPKVTLGQVLRVNREKLSLSLEDVSQKTLIKKEYLLNFETGIYTLLKDDVYTRQFLRKYADVLGLSYDLLFELYFYEYKQYKKHHHVKKIIHLHPLSFIFPHKWFWRIILILISLSVFGYLGYRFFLIVLPPSLTVYEPASHEMITDRRSMEVSGKTDEKAKVSINGQSILIEPDGNFSTFVDLREGVNILTISAQKKHGKEKTETRYIIVE